MRKGFPDAPIVSNELTAAHNILVVSQEFARVEFTSWYAALLIAGSLENLSRKYAAERVAGARHY
jgi:hypothetical protein